MPRRARALASAMALPMSLVLLACGGGEDADTATATEEAAASTEAAPSTPAGQTPAVTPQPAETPAPPPKPAQVPEVLDFTAETVDGASFSGASLAGTNTVLWFWAPWCPVCARGAGEVSDAATELGSSVQFVGVGGLSGNRADMQDFVRDTQTQQLTHLADTDGALYTRFMVTKQHTFAFVSPDGTVQILNAYGTEPDLAAEARQRFGL